MITLFDTENKKDDKKLAFTAKLPGYADSSFLNFKSGMKLSLPKTESHIQKNKEREATDRTRRGESTKLF